MAQPPAYNREKNFTLNSGRETDHAALNAELDRASNSINDIRSNLAVLQADDGKLRPFVVTPDSISEELRVSLVEGVVMDAQAMLDESKAASEASVTAAEEAKASETKAASSAASAAASEKEAAKSAEIALSAVNADWGAEEGPAQILNKPVLAEVATSGSYEDLQDKPVIGGVPVGTVEYFAREEMPAGYLLATGQALGRNTYPALFSAIGTAYGEGDGETTFNLPRLGDAIGAIVPFASLHMPQDFMPCDGSEISREQYAELFAVIGTSYGEGDGTSTFKLPNLIGRFAEGSATPGTVKEAGLPNIEGSTGSNTYHDLVPVSGPFKRLETTHIIGTQGTDYPHDIYFDASLSNPIYGASDTVQPPALTVCYGIKVKNRLHAAIKAFDASVDQGLVDITELANDIQKAQTPAGTVAWFAMTAPPVGYLIANGAAVGRETYPDLYAAIGETYGEGDGTSTFNLPNLIGRFAEGSATPGVVKEAGLPNITANQTGISKKDVAIDGAAYYTDRKTDVIQGGVTNFYAVNFDASRSNPIYGASNTVQPPALTLLPCIKAFDATVNSGLINVTELAQEVAKKTDSIAAAHAALPSGQYVDLTLPATGGTITAPADGYIVFRKKTGTSVSGAQYASLVGDVEMNMQHTTINAIVRLFIPVRKDSAVQVNYDLTGPTEKFGFVYANGSQP